MEPTLYLSQQAFQCNARNVPHPQEIDAFYQTHGKSAFSTISRWRAALGAIWQRLTFERRETTNIVPIAHRG